MAYLSSALLHARITAGYANRPGVLQDVEFEVDAGQIVGLVGESGSGKSTVAMAILRLLAYRGGHVQGEIRFQGRELLRLSERQMRAVRGREIGLVLQSPLSSLNPAMTIGDQLREAYSAHRQDRTAPSSFQRPSQRVPDLLELLETVNLEAKKTFLDRYPRQISVGQAQRVLIAMAIVHRPALLIADEPTSALDTITQAEILKLFARLNRDLGMSVLYISHDLLSVASLCHRIAILREGRVVETGATADIFRRPQDPYTRALLNAIPTSPFTDSLSTRFAGR